MCEKGKARLFYFLGRSESCILTINTLHTVTLNLKVVMEIRLYVVSL